MLVLTLTYKADLAEVDRHLEAHVAWLKAGIADGWLLAAGRQVPRTGGVLLARGERAEIERLAATDPFVTQGVAEVLVTEVTLALVAPGLEALKG